MKALYTKEPGDFSLVYLEEPIPKDDEVKIKVDSCAICHTDVIIKQGKALHLKFPVVPGHEFSGTVVECGKNVTSVKPGDRGAVQTIMGCGACPPCRNNNMMRCENYKELGNKLNGGMAEYCVFPARFFYKIPDHISFEVAAMAEPLANAVKAIRYSRLKPCERVVIIGPGAIGLLVAQVAKLYNPEVLIVVGTRDSRLEFAKKFCGATHVVNVKNKDGLRILKEDILKGQGADVVIECAGTVNAIQSALDIVARNGRIVIEGSVDVNETIPLSPRYLQGKQASLTGIIGWETCDFQKAIDLIIQNKVSVEQFITQKFSIDEWEKAFEYVTVNKSESIRVVIKP